MRCIPFLLTSGASLVFVAVGAGAPADSAAPDPPAAAEPAVPAVWLETQSIPELDQTIFYVRCSEAIDGIGTLEIRDEEGGLKASVEMPVAAGTGLLVWDGQGPEGERLPSDVYEARWVFGDLEGTAPLVR